MSETVTFNVGMTCGGCSGAVERILKKIDGIADDGVTCDLEAKTVVIKYTEPANPDLMNEALQKWSAASGKSVELVK
jgi:copper chaperone